MYFSLLDKLDEKIFKLHWTKISQSMQEIFLVRMLIEEKFKIPVRFIAKMYYSLLNKLCENSFKLPRINISQSKQVIIPLIKFFDRSTALLKLLITVIIICRIEQMPNRHGNAPVKGQNALGKKEKPFREMIVSRIRFIKLPKLRSGFF
jgi:hypothetical protein